MKNFFKKHKIIIGVLSVVVLAYLGLRFKTIERSQENKVVKIGFIGPLSETNANIGEGIKNAIEMAREKINDDANVKTKIEVVYEDDQFNGRLGISAYHKLRDIDKVEAIINTTPATINAFQPLLKNDKNPIVVIQIATPEIIEDDTIFQIIPTGEIIYGELGKLAADKYNSLAFVYQNGSAFEKAKDVFEEMFKKANKKFTAYRIDEALDSKDYRSLASKIISDGFDAFTFLSTPKVGVPFLQQFSQQNKDGKMKLLCNADLEITIGSYLESINQNIFEDCHSTTLPNQLPEWFKNAYVEKYKTEPTFAVDFAYDSLEILSKNYDSDVRKWKNNLQNLNHDGISGKIMFNQKGDRLGQQVEIHIFKDGKFVPLGD